MAMAMVAMARSVVLRRGGHNCCRITSAVCLRWAAAVVTAASANVVVNKGVGMGIGGGDVGGCRGFASHIGGCNPETDSKVVNVDVTDTNTSPTASPEIEIESSFAAVAPASSNRSRNASAEELLFSRIVSHASGNGTARRPFVLCGPSGVGKSYLIGRLLKRLPTQVAMVVSHTTRSPRPGEVNGTSYHFVSDEEFDSLIKAGAFVEYDSIHGNRYGTTYSAVGAVHRANKTCLMDMTAAGAVEFREACAAWQNKLGIPSPWIAYIRPPSMEELEKWLRHRNSEDDASLNRRLRQAEKELREIDDLDIFDEIIIKNWVD